MACILARIVLQVAARDRQLDPLLRNRAVDADDLLEGGARGVHVALPERALAERAQRAHVLGVELEYPGPVPDRIAVPA